jgi:hypothetical protein
VTPNQNYNPTSPVCIDNPKMGFLSLDNKDPLAAIDDAGSSDGVC